jgi:hypothetical protein
MWGAEQFISTHQTASLFPHGSRSRRPRFPFPKSSFLSEDYLRTESESRVSLSRSVSISPGWRTLFKLLISPSFLTVSFVSLYLSGNLKILQLETQASQQIIVPSESIQKYSQGKAQALHHRRLSLFNRNLEGEYAKIERRHGGVGKEDINEATPLSSR